MNFVSAYCQIVYLYFSRLISCLPFCLKTKEFMSRTIKTFYSTVSVETMYVSQKNICLSLPTIFMYLLFSFLISKSAVVFVFYSYCWDYCGGFLSDKSEKITIKPLPSKYLFLLMDWTAWLKASSWILSELLSNIAATRICWTPSTALRRIAEKMVTWNAILQNYLCHTKK